MKTRTSTPAAPLLTGKPWLYVGLSRSAWYRLMSAGLTPPPVAVPGSGRKWRTRDLVAFVEKLAK